MAKVTVEGTVARTFYNGKGAEVVEEFTVKSEPRKVRWACWFDEPHGLTEGQVVSVTGLHSDQVDEWEKDGQKRHSVKRSINKARVGASHSPQEPRSGVSTSGQALGDTYGNLSPQATDSGNWSSMGGGDNDTPF